MTVEAYEKFKNYPDVNEIVSLKRKKENWDKGMFPHDPQFQWDVNFYGPLYIPQKDATVVINTESISFYKRVIEVYEGSEMGLDQKITTSGTEVLLNGAPITEYTFLQDYYWMMGDNRNNSEDARSWGYTPSNHVVGKPVFVWMSFNNTNQSLFNWSPRWERFFTTVGGNGKPVSYFYYFLGLLAAWYVFTFFRKKRKNA